MSKDGVVLEDGLARFGTAIGGGTAVGVFFASLAVIFWRLWSDQNVEPGPWLFWGGAIGGFLGLVALVTGG